MKRFRKSLLISGTLLACAVGAAFVWSTLAAERRTAALRAKGYPTTLTELNEWYESPPVGENAADYYIEAGGLIDASRFPGKNRLAVFGDGVLNVAGAKVPAEEMERTEAFILSHHEAYAALAYASEFGGSRYPIDFSKGGLAHRIDFYTPVAAARQALLLKFYYHCRLGEQFEAIVTFEQYVHLVNSLDDSPSWFGISMRIPLLQEAIGAAEHILSTLPLNEISLTDLDDALLSLTNNDQMLRVAVGNRCLIDVIHSNRIGVTRFLTPTARAHFDSESYAFIELVAHPSHEIVAELLELERQPRRDFLIRQVPGLRRWTRKLAEYSPGHCASDALRLIHAEARVASARAAIRIARARADTHALPEHLQDLPPEYLEDWPVDPFTNEPIRYRRLESGYVTYSVSSNLTDDGGIEPEHYVNIASPPKAFDATFRVLR